MLYVPDIAEVAILNRILEKTGGVAEPWTIRLFSNDLIPGPGTLLANIVEVSAGGYIAVALDKALFTVSQGTPSIALYNTFIDFQFNDVTAAPAVIYGYYITDVNNIPILIERFPPENVPFTPINGSLIRVRPRFTLNTIVI